MARQASTPALEWITAGIGLLLVLALLGTLLDAAIDRHGEHMPILSATVDRIADAGDHHVVTVTVTNRSGVTAATVEVEGVLAGGTGAEEASSATIDYVPGRGEAQAGLLFRDDPRRARLELRITGFDTP